MARDRIISGLSLAVIVIEAGIKSGTLDTAAKAQRQGRALFAVPGSPGTDALLSAGATVLDPQHPDYDGMVERLMTLPRRPAEIQMGLWA
jgi:DNA processing protein